MRRTIGSFLLATAFGGSAFAQASPTPAPVIHVPRAAPPALPAAPPSSGRALRDHFGIELAARLIASSEPDERLRGLERLASLGTPEAVSMLVHFAREGGGRRKIDSRALLLLVRGLAERTSLGEVRQLLKDGVLGAVGPRALASPADPEDEGEERDARIALARDEAALALAGSREPRAVEAVIAVAQDGGPGQSAAMRALLASPPEKVATAMTGPLSPALLQLAGRLGDLRAVDSVRAALHATDPATRAAAFDAAVELGDGSAVEAAGALEKDAEPKVREAAASALVRLGSTKRFRAVEALLGDPVTAAAGARLASLASDPGVDKALAALAVATDDPGARAQAIVALGRSRDDLAIEALLALANDALRGGDAAAALGRSPAPGAWSAIQALLAAPGTRRLGARAYALRAVTFEAEEPAGTAALEALGESRDPRDRAVGLSGLVVLGRRDARQALADPDAAVRRSVALAALGDPREATRAGLLRASNHEPDALTRRVERGALAGGDPGADVAGEALREAVREGAADAPLSASVLASRGSSADAETIDGLLDSRDPILRAHVCRGLGDSGDPVATGRLAHAYAFEVDPMVRRAIVLALARRVADAGSPARASVLRTAARLDPDRGIREAAVRVLAGLAAEPRPATTRDLAWIRLEGAGGGAPRETGFAGTVVGTDGVALPVAFDDDGFALVPIPPGEARLLLTPRLPVYEVPAR